MKITFNREVKIGLSVVLVLTITLVVVAVRRFTRHSPLPDAEMVVESASMEKLRDEQRAKGLEVRKPTFAESAPALLPDAGHELGKGDTWEALGKEHHEAKADQPAEQKPTGKDAASVAALAKHERKDERNEAARELAEAADDRYAATPATALPTPNRYQATPAKPAVIQVTGESEVPARHPDGRASSVQVNPYAAEQGYPPAGSPTNTLRPDHMDNRQPRKAEPPHYEQPRNELAAAPQAYPGRDPRYGYEPTAAAAPVESGPPGYPGPAAGYGRDAMPRRAEPQSEHPINPLRADGMYEVLPNDSYWTISERIYGTGAYFRALAEVNRGKAARPDRLSPGLLISTPPIAQLEKDYPDYCPRPNRREAIRNRAAQNGSTASLAGYTGGRTYVVQEGDTLTSIARNELGKVSRWAEIYQLNRESLGKDYDYLTPGMKLAMPPRETQSPDRTTRRGDETGPYTR